LRLLRQAALKIPQHAANLPQCGPKIAARARHSPGVDQKEVPAMKKLLLAMVALVGVGGAAAQAATVVVFRHPAPVFVRPVLAPLVAVAPVPCAVGYVPDIAARRIYLRHAAWERFHTWR